MCLLRDLGLVAESNQFRLLEDLLLDDRVAALVVLGGRVSWDHETLVDL